MTGLQICLISLLLELHAALLTAAALCATNGLSATPDSVFDLLEDFALDNMDTQEDEFKIAKAKLTETKDQTGACSSSCRQAYHVCLRVFDEVTSKEVCAELYVVCLNRCFYSAPKQSQSRLTSCQLRQCLANFDKCVDLALGLPEVFVCRSGRDSCIASCLETNYKRTNDSSCHNNCAWNLKMCQKLAVTDETFMCSAAQSICKTNCARKAQIEN